ncbi:hypothetical protein [Saccharolobus islandicus]|uniref:hypothetical protein n=1 Tax=Saccharolobus islandicus TaxID=43080 RepID=UPI001EE64FF6|nr:hypothetical protein [Sulfolobus islandicus]
MLGIFTPSEIGLISYEDVLSQLNDPVLSVLYRDPWIIPFIESYDELKKRIKEFSLVAKGLIGGFSKRRKDNSQIYITKYC